MVTGVLGREAEMVAVDKLLDSGRRGRAALVLEGNPGIGKTTVWRQGISRAADAQYRVLTCRTAPTEARLSFTALSDLLAPLESAAFASLPDPQRRALDAALLRAHAEGAANPRAIGTAVVSLLSRLAASGPVLLAIDDLQWLDMPSARALEFALRRLDAQPIAVLATARLGERGGVPRLPGIDRFDTVRLGPLSLAALYRIIEAELGRALSRPLLVKLEQACGGNPFYALEIARALEPTANLLPGQELPIPDNLRELLAKRLRKLPPRTRDALLRVERARAADDSPGRCRRSGACGRGRCRSRADRWPHRVLAPVVRERRVCSGVAGPEGAVARRGRRYRERHRGARQTPRACALGDATSMSTSPTCCTTQPSTRCGAAPSTWRQSSTNSRRDAHRRSRWLFGGSVTCAPLATI